MNTKSNNLKGSLILCFTALIWGLAFVAQSKASSVPPFAVNALRSAISVPFLYIVFKIKSKKSGESLIPGEPKSKKAVIKGAVMCGIMLAISVNFQQFGISAYPKGAAVEAHSGFVTAMYVVIVPLVSLFLKKRVSPIIWLSVAISVFGFYLLCFRGGIDGFYTADLLVLLCAFSFAFHIITVDRNVGKIGGLRLSILQFCVCSVVSAVLSLIFEIKSYDFDILIKASPYILYLGIMSSAVGYTLQIVGQKYAEPAIASLAMSLESVFAAIGGVLAGNTLSVREMLGCAVVFSAIVIAQLPEMLAKKSVESGEGL